GTPEGLPSGNPVLSDAEPYAGLAKEQDLPLLQAAEDRLTATAGQERGKAGAGRSATPPGPLLTKGTSADRSSRAHGPVSRHLPVPHAGSTDKDRHAPSGGVGTGLVGESRIAPRLAERTRV